MATLTVRLTDESMKRLEALATEARVSPAEFAQANLEKALAPRETAFEQALQATLTENLELYRRLAK